MPFSQTGRNWAYSHSKGSGFRDIGRFSKYPYLGMSRGQIWIFGHEPWPLAKVPVVAHYVTATYPLLLPHGSKVSLLSHYGQQFPRCGVALKIAIFGHETWPLAKVQKLHIHSLSTLGGRNWAYFCSKGSDFRDTGRISKLIYLGMLIIGKGSRICTYTLYQRNSAYFALRAMVKG